MSKQKFDPCPLGHDRDDIRLNPRNLEAAYAVQFHDDARVLYSVAHVSPKSFENALKVLETHIATYRGQRA